MIVEGMSRRASFVNSYGLAKDGTGDRDGALAERRLLLLGEAVEVLLRGDLVPDHRLLDVLEVRVERRLPGRGIDVDHRGDPLRDPVARRVAAEPGRAVDGEDDRDVRGLDRGDDRIDVVREGDRRPVGVGRLEPGQRQRGDVVAVGAERAATSSHAQAPSQNPGTRMIGALVIGEAPL